MAISKKTATAPDTSGDAAQAEVTVRDVEQLQHLLLILGDPRVRVEVSHGDSQKPSFEMPASSRFQFTNY